MAYQRMQDARNETRAGDVLMVVHDFDARSSDELTLRRGDRIALVELDDGFGDGWYLGRHLGSGGTGLFPGVYTTKLPAGIPNLRLNGPSVRASLPSEPFMFQNSSFNQAQQDPRPVSHSPAGQSSLAQQPETSPLYQGIALSSGPVAEQNSDSKRPTSMAAPSASSMPSIQRSISETMGHSRNGQESPVMNETLSVIDEHMNDLSTPRHSLANDTGNLNDSESEYSSHLDSHPSYMRRPSSASGDKLLESEVKQWTPRQTAEYLRNMGVEQKHCDIFEEQEISGDVILEMDQHFIYMKEYDFGPMGRRLKTWHRIRDLQEEVRGPKNSRQNTSVAMENDSSEHLSQYRSNVTPDDDSIFPRMAGFKETPGLMGLHSRQSSNADPYPTPLQTQSSANTPRHTPSAAAAPGAWRASIGSESPVRPSAASIREFNHSRRHSSLDTGSVSGFDPSGTTLGSLSSHKKTPSFDREWSMISNTNTNASPRFDTMGSSSTPYRLSTIMQEVNDNSSDTSLLPEPSTVDLDRGYFSGNEIENRKSRNVLRKRDSASSPGHSRVTSMVEAQKPPPSTVKRHSRIGSVDSIRDLVPSVTSTASKAYHSNAFKGRLRSSSARPPMRASTTGGASPVVTNLEDESTSPSPVIRRGNSGNNSPLAPTASNKARRIMGLRTISDVVTESEKTSATPPTISSPIKESSLDSPARTGSTTPSVTSKSLEMDSTDASLKGADPTIMMTPQSRPSTRPRAKSKRETSAYTRGLQKMSPAEQRIGCDYSGWMKKKSSGLVTTWKPRLFILRGRRLSYYYSEDDKEERGVIDISSHKVLVANQDAIASFHAAFTSAATTATPPTNISTSEPPSEKTPTTERTVILSAPFYFKLVPPKAGLSRAVQFTKPTVHYFQADNIAEGRKWMGAMMKATIEHTAMDFETTNKQKTISLAKARARKERPPALKEALHAGEDSESTTPDHSAKGAGDMALKETGLNIRGLSFDEPSNREVNPNANDLAHKKMASVDTPQSKETLQSLQIPESVTTGST